MQTGEGLSRGRVGRDGWHVQGSGLLDKFIHSDRSIQQRVLAVHVEVDERLMGHLERLRAPFPLIKCLEEKVRDGSV